MNEENYDRDDLLGYEPDSPEGRLLAAMLPHLESMTDEEIAEAVRKTRAILRSRETN